jgi:Animal haem peroxidase
MAQGKDFGMAGSIVSRMLASVSDVLDSRVGWHRLPRPLGILTLIGLRTRLRERNLYDTNTTEPARDSALENQGRVNLNARRIDGSYNDLGDPAMGSIGSRFGRNVSLERTYPESHERLLEPNPRLVSQELLTRHEFIPATTLNVLAGAWLQFEVHDWFSHESEEENPWEVDLSDEDDWPERPMRIRRTRRDPSYKESEGPPTYVTSDSHWWDGSQIYGNSEKFAAGLRAGEDGKLRLDDDGMLPRDLEDLVDLSGVAGNWWVGLALLHTLFTREHNAIADRLKTEFPAWTDDQLYDHARLVNAALMAKIHTVEWTPAIIAHPTTRLAMHANWWGIMGEAFTKRFGRLGSSEVLSGIPGSPTNHHGVPYSLTEEFVAVYRMHPLLPDEFTFSSVMTGGVIERREFPELGALQARTRLEELSLPNAFYSLGIEHPGAITLHNYPRFLQRFDRPDGETMDLAATDILRVRERGVPRYNEFRRLFRLEPAESFTDLTDNPKWQREIQEVYDNDIERVDLMVGLYGEPLPPGFGFSDTAFRVFILMASRRLKSDRFFTTDYTADVYTQVGLDWINENSMVSVLLRHFPQLGPALDGIENAFAPWRRVAAA